jgi:hypothetical protein
MAVVGPTFAHARNRQLDNYTDNNITFRGEEDTQIQGKTAKMQRSQSKILRMITNAWRYVTNQILHFFIENLDNPEIYHK